MPTAVNVVRFRVVPGGEEDFIEAHRSMQPAFRGFLGGHLVRTGDRTFCMVGHWRDFQSLAQARPQMIAVLDRFRHLLEDLGGNLGVTDPVSGETVAELPWSERPAAKKSAAGKRPAKAKARSKAKAKAKPRAKAKSRARPQAKKRASAKRRR